MRTVRSSAHVLIADPFRMYKREENGTKICMRKYIGPTQAVLDSSNDCVSLVSPGNSMVDNLILSPSPDACREKKLMVNAEKLFRTEECKDESEYDKFEFIQIKDLKSNNYVYCPTLNITVFNTTYPCPPFIFSLPHFTSFTIDELHYHADQLKLHSTLDVIPENSARVNFHILPLLPDLDFENSLRQAVGETKQLGKGAELTKVDDSLDYMSIFEICSLLIIFSTILAVAVKRIPCQSTGCLRRCRSQNKSSRVSEPLERVYLTSRRSRRNRIGIELLDAVSEEEDEPAPEKKKEMKRTSVKRENDSVESGSLDS